MLPGQTEAYHWCFCSAQTHRDSQACPDLKKPRLCQPPSRTAEALKPPTQGNAGLWGLWGMQESWKSSGCLGQGLRPSHHYLASQGAQAHCSKAPQPQREKSQ